MKYIAIAIMVIGLCFYNGFLIVNGQEGDPVVALVAFIGAIILLV